MSTKQFDMDSIDLDKEEKQISAMNADKSNFVDQGEVDENMLHFKDSVKKVNGKHVVKIRVRFLPSYYVDPSLGTNTKGFVGGKMHKEGSICTGRGCKLCSVGIPTYMAVKEQGLSQGLDDKQAKEYAKKKAYYHFGTDTYFRNCLVIEDTVNPANVGKIKVFVARGTLNELIFNLTNPSQDTIEAGASALSDDEIKSGKGRLDPTSLHDGNDFLFVRTMGDKNGKPDHEDTKYDGSLFFPSAKSKQFTKSDDVETRKKALLKIFKASPDLKEYYDPETMIIKTKEEAQSRYTELFNRKAGGSGGGIDIGDAGTDGEAQDTKQASDDELLKKMEAEMQQATATDTATDTTTDTTSTGVNIDTVDMDEDDFFRVD